MCPGRRDRQERTGGKKDDALEFSPGHLIVNIHTVHIYIHML